MSQHELLECAAELGMSVEDFIAFVSREVQKPDSAALKKLGDRVIIVAPSGRMFQLKVVTHEPIAEIRH